MNLEWKYCYNEELLDNCFQNSFTAYNTGKTLRCCVINNVKCKSEKLKLV